MTSYHPVIVYTDNTSSNPVEWTGTGYDTLSEGYLAMWSREKDLLDQGYAIESLTVKLRCTEVILVKQFLQKVDNE